MPKIELNNGYGVSDNPYLNQNVKQNNLADFLLQDSSSLVLYGANEFNQRLGQPSIDEPDQSFHDLDMANHTLKRPRNDLNNVGMQSMGQNQQQQNPISQAAAQRSCNSSYHSQDEEEKEKREMEQNQDAQTVKMNLKKQIHKNFRDLKVQNVKKVTYGENSVLDEYNRLTGIEQHAISIIQKVKKVPKLAIKFTFHLRFLLNDQFQAIMHTLLAFGDTSTIVLLTKQKNSFTIAKKYIRNAMFNVIDYKLAFKKAMDKRNQEHVRELNGLEEEIKYLESVIDALREQDPMSYQRRQEQMNMVQQQWQDYYFYFYQFRVKLGAQRPVENEFEYLKEFYIYFNQQIQFIQSHQIYSCNTIKHLPLYYLIFQTQKCIKLIILK